MDKSSSRSGTKRKTSKQIFSFEPLKTVVDGIAKTFGPRCEVVLFDLRNPQRSIVKIANGYITGRAAGGPLHEDGVKYLKRGGKEDFVVSPLYITKDSRRIRCTTTVFKNDKKKPIAALTINFDLTDILNFNVAIEDTFGISKMISQDKHIEPFNGDIVSTLNEVADNIIRKTGRAIPSMGRKDKIEIVRQLEVQGFFMIRGAVKLIARKFNVSKYTIYNYIERVQSEKEQHSFPTKLQKSL